MFPSLPETTEDKKDRLLRRICRLAAVILIVSVVSIVVGIVAVAKSGSKFPYNAGGAMIAGIAALLLALCPFCMFYEAKKTGDSVYDNTGCFDCCTFSMVIWFSITILAIPIGFGISGIYGVAACVNESEKSKVCTDNAESKLALSVLTIIVTSVLFILALAIFFTCCCNSSTFGIPLLNSYSDTSDIYNIRHDPYRYSGTSHRGESPDIAIHNALSQTGREELRPRPDTSNSENVVRTLGEPSAPPIGADRDERSVDIFNIDTGPTPSFPAATNRYADPPPSYGETMKTDSSETPPSYYQVIEMDYSETPL